MAIKVSIVDYGCGNLFSVAMALQHLGAEPLVSADPRVIASAELLIIPGVGAFPKAMQRLRDSGLDDAIRTFASSGRPYLGICLGMQLLLEESEEFGFCAGLGLVRGRVVPLPVTDSAGKAQKVPQIGWNRLVPTAGMEHLPPVLSAADMVPEVYFVHSYMAEPELGARVADCEYGGYRVCAAVRKDNGLGVQFHPEKSGEFGLSILKNFFSF